MSKFLKVKQLKVLFCVKPIVQIQIHFDCKFKYTEEILDMNCSFMSINRLLGYQCSLNCRLD